MPLKAFGKEFTLLNDWKVDRAINGTVGRQGLMVGGVGKSAAPEQVIAEYDRLGGGIKLGTDKVKRGCFWDFTKQAAIAEPKVILVFNINGHTVEADADAPLPAMVRAAQTLAGQEGKPDLSGMTIPQLKLHAEQLGVDLTGIRTKQEIIESIQAH